MSINTDQVWQTALGQLQLQMTRATFDTWVKDTYIVEQEDDYLVIGTKNVFAKDWLENRLSNTISRTLASVLGRPVGIEFIVDSVNGSGN